jgi:putative serine protease PepD
MEVVFNDKKTSSATVVGRDPSSDIAVVKPETTHSLPPLSLGDSEALAVGDPVIAIGSPLGLQGSVTTGIVSSLNRPVPTQGETPGDGAVLNAIQTDAAINPGNSGGPLVDMDGRVIGINTAIATVSPGGLGDAQGGNIGVGFAIPSKKAEAVAEQLISTGKARRAVIGIRIDTAFQGTGVKIIGSDVNGEPPLTKGGPAEKAGLKPGDVITVFDGKPVEGPADLIAMITSKNPGDKVKLAYQRGGKETTVEATLGEAG